MTSELTLPELGENIETIQVAKVLVSEGERIEVDQPVLELETDKATIELPSSRAGTVSGIHVQRGDEAKVGQRILSFRDGDAEAPSRDDAGTRPEETPSEPRSARAGKPGEATREQASPGAPQSGATPAPDKASRRVPAAPSVRRFARELGVDITQVHGTGPGGRLSRDDVKAFARRALSTAAPAAAPAADMPDFSRWGEVRRESMSVIRRKTAEHMALSWNRIPHVTIYDKADITELEELRKRYAAHAEKAGGKLTWAVMVCKVAAAALRSFPKFNSSIDTGRREIVYKEAIHLGVAVAIERGLVVPVIRNADTKNMVQLAAEIADIATRAREGKIAVEDMQGGTFTVTNLGRIGGTWFTPIVNYPEVAILGIGRACREPGLDARGAMAPRMVLPLSLSFDHRLIDGAEGAQFLAWIVQAIQEPFFLALEG